MLDPGEHLTGGELAIFPGDPTPTEAAETIPGCCRGDNFENFRIMERENMDWGFQDAGGVIALGIRQPVIVFRAGSSISRYNSAATPNGMAK